MVGQEFTFSCGHCEQPLVGEMQSAGNEVVCPACQKVIVVPGGPGTMETHPAADESEPTRPAPRSGRRERIVFFAFVGALALSTIVQMPALLLAVVNPGGNRDGGMGSRLLEMGAMVMYRGLLGPWGLLGAVLGGGWAWKRSLDRHGAAFPPGVQEAASAEREGTATDAPKFLRRGEVSLAFGLAFLVLATGLYPSVMVWMLGLYVAPVAVTLLLFGVLRARGPAGSGSRRAGGLLLLTLTLVPLCFAALGGSTLSYKISAPQAPIPAVWDLPRVIVLWVLPILFIGPGLRFWTNWSPSRRRGWCAVVLLVPLATLLLHRTLVTAGLLPLSA